jgi:hypothetical protein
MAAYFFLLNMTLNNGLLCYVQLATVADTIHCHFVNYIPHILASSRQSKNSLSSILYILNEQKAAFL